MRCIHAPVFETICPEAKSLKLRVRSELKVLGRGAGEFGGAGLVTWARALNGHPISSYVCVPFKSCPVRIILKVN
jgi:hypothetical protein